MTKPYDLKQQQIILLAGLFYFREWMKLPVYSQPACIVLNSIIPCLYTPPAQNVSTDSVSNNAGSSSKSSNRRSQIKKKVMRDIVMQVMRSLTAWEQVNKSFWQDCICKHVNLTQFLGCFSKYLEALLWPLFLSFEY